MTGIALAGLCLSTATRAQVGYTGPMVDCYGVVCVPVVSVGAYTVPGFTVPWALRARLLSNQSVAGQLNASTFATGFPSRGVSSSAIPSKRIGRDDDARGGKAERGKRNHEGDQDDHGNGRGEEQLSRFNPATVIYTGLAATALFSFLNSSSGASTTTPVVESSVVTPTVAAPLTAHVEFAPATALMATTDLVTTPEPMTQTLMATGLVAVGMLVFIRRRRRTND
jgi:MYXO-CTERM domain-containing protein